MSSIEYNYSVVPSGSGLGSFYYLTATARVMTLVFVNPTGAAINVTVDLMFGFQFVGSMSFNFNVNPGQQAAYVFSHGYTGGTLLANVIGDSIRISSPSANLAHQVRLTY